MTPGIRITLRCTFSPLMDKGQAGPGDPAAHRTDRLPLLPSGPGGVHRVLSHRAQPLILNVKSKKGKVASTYNRNFCLLTSYFYLALVWRRGWAFEVARAEPALAPTEGASPLICSPRGGYIPHDPPVRIPPSPFFISPELPRLIPQCLFVAERVGFEPTVPLLGRMLSKHVDSSTLAPLRTDFREAAS